MKRPNHDGGLPRWRSPPLHSGSTRRHWRSRGASPHLRGGGTGPGVPGYRPYPNADLRVVAVRTHTIYLQAALLARAPVCANGPGRANPPHPPPPPFKHPPLSFPHTGSSFLWQAATTPRVVLSQSSVAIAHADQDGAELGALVAAAWVVPSRKHNSKNLRPGRRTELPCPRPALRNWGMIMASVTNGSRVWSCCTVRPVRIHRPQCSLPESRVAIVLFSKKKKIPGFWSH